MMTTCARFMTLVRYEIMLLATQRTALLMIIIAMPLGRYVECKQRGGEMLRDDFQRMFADSELEVFSGAHPAE